MNIALNENSKLKFQVYFENLRYYSAVQTHLRNEIHLSIVLEIEKNCIVSYYTIKDLMFNTTFFSGTYTPNLIMNLNMLNGYTLKNIHIKLNKVNGIYNTGVGTDEFIIEDEIVPIGSLLTKVFYIEQDNEFLLLRDFLNKYHEINEKSCNYNNIEEYYIDLTLWGYPVQYNEERDVRYYFTNQSGISYELEPIILAIEFENAITEAKTEIRFNDIISGNILMFNIGNNGTSYNYLNSLFSNGNYTSHNFNDTILDYNFYNLVFPKFKFKVMDAFAFDVTHNLISNVYGVYLTTKIKLLDPMPSYIIG